MSMTNSLQQLALLAGYKPEPVPKALDFDDGYTGYSDSYNYFVVDYDDLIESHHQALLDEYDIIATLSEAEANWS